MHGAHHLAAPLTQFARRRCLAIAEATVPVHIDDARAQFVAHGLERCNHIHIGQLAVAAIQFQQHFQHEIELHGHHLLVADGTKSVDPAAGTARQAARIGRRRAVAQTVDHLVFIGDAVGQRKHRFHAAAVHAQGAAYPQRLGAAGAHDCAITVGLVGQCLHGNGCRRVTAILRVRRQGGQGLHEAARHREHGFDLQRVAHDDSTFCAPQAAQRRLRHGLARFIDE